MNNRYRIIVAIIISLTVVFLIYKSLERNNSNNDLIFVEPRPVIQLDSLNSFEFLSNNPKSSLASNFQKFKASFDSIVYDEKAYYIVEGDIRLNEDELFMYYLKTDTIEKPQTIYDINQVQLVIGLNDEKELDIMPNAKGLTYAVYEDSFDLPLQCEQVRKNFQKAANEWSKKLDGAVNFEHLAHLDSNKDLELIKNKVSFVIKFSNPKNSSIAELAALAFFPSSDKKIWNVNVLPGYFVTDYDKVGVFRHEIGHILGFRHEHALDDSPDACKKSDTPVKKLSNYDSVSLMHYFCGGYGNKKLTFTQRDIEGAQCIYNKNNIPCDLDY